MRILPTALFPLLGLAACSGCSSAERPTAPIAAVKPKADARGLGLRLLGQALDVARYREALNVLNADLGHNAELRARIVLNDAARAFLEKAGLDRAEIQLAASPTFTPADAHYLAGCFLLRDAARAVEIGRLAPAEQARRAFGWVERNVVLHQHGEDWLPPSLVLRRGFGNARDRALAFLALMRQLQVEGCVFSLPDAPDDAVLAGVLDKGGKDVYLFDPRLGFAVRTAAGKVATLKDVQADPSLLKPSALSAEQLKTLQVRIACPLEAAAPRMRELERALTAQDRIVLYLDPARLQRDVAQATGLAVSVWNAPAGTGETPNSPVRAWRLLLPPEEGGVDTTNRFARLQADRVPWTAIVMALDQIKLGPGQLAEPALAQLEQMAADLVEKYAVQPHEMLLRGKSAEVIQRLDRARSFLEDESLATLADEPAFQTEVAKWRAHAAAAYGALANKEPQAQALVNRLWGEDGYLPALLQVNGEERPDARKKSLLTHIVGYAVRDTVVRRAFWLRAMVWHEKAERDHDLAGAAGANPSAAANAVNAWRNTRIAWNLYADRAGLSPTARQQRLDTIRAVMKRGGDAGARHAAHLLGTLQLEIHDQVAARLHHARAQRYVDGKKAAIALLNNLEPDLDALVANGNAGAFPAEAAAVLERLRASRIGVVAHSAALLDRDWGAHGTFDWQRTHLQQQRARWEK